MPTLRFGLTKIIIHLQTNTSEEHENKNTKENMTILDPTTGCFVVLDRPDCNSMSDEASIIFSTGSSDNYEPPSDMSCSETSETDEYCNDVQTQNNVSISTGRPKKGRKLKYCMSRATSKLNWNCNETYVNYKGILKPKKEFLVNYNCNCSKKCSDFVSIDERKEEFSRFWSLASYNAQSLFISNHIEEAPKKRCYGRNIDKRKFSRIYRILDKVVCREMFINTFRISTGRVTTALKKVHNRAPILDQRGKKQGGLNKVSQEKIDHVIAHIERIPKYISHYCREKTTARYLPPHLTLSKLYELYKTEHETPVTFAIYKRIFYDKFNLKFKVSQKDTCQVCDAFKAKLRGESDEHNKQLIQIQYDEHLICAKKARSLLKEDLKKAKSDEDTECLSFDLQKTLPLPRIPSNIIFYKRQVWLYNMGVYSGKDNKSFSYTWMEGTAGKGSQEIGSCLLRHLRDIPDKVQHLILWSDSCGGQNRNIKLTLMMNTLLQSAPNLKTVTFKFLIPGHSFLPNDKDFGDIECQLKRHERLYTPLDYINIIKNCRKKNPIISVQMKKEWFMGTERLEKSIVNRKIDITKQKINWLKTRQITLKKETPYYLYMSTDFNSCDSCVVDIQRKCRASVDFLSLLMPLWSNGKPLAEAKVKDIKSYMHLIPSDAKSFYLNFTGSPNIVEDVDGLNVGELDFEIEIQE